MSCREIVMKVSWQLLLCSILQEKPKFKFMLYRGLKGSHPNDSTQGQFSGRFKHVFCLHFKHVLASSLLRLMN